MKQDAVNVDAINLEANSRMIDDENCVYGGMAQTEGPHCKVGKNLLFLVLSCKNLLTVAYWLLLQQR